MQSDQQSLFESKIGSNYLYASDTKKDKKDVLDMKQSKS